MVDCGVGVLDCTGEEFEGVDDSILGSDLWLGKVFAEYLDSVEDDDGFFCCIDDLEAEVLLKRGAYDEIFADAEEPQDLQVPGLVYMNTGMTGGAMGVVPKLKGPLK